jgi:predicted transcriptional regulator
MNDKDKEAFNEWRNSTSTRLDIHDAWQAACEYKDSEQYIEGSIHESGGIKREMTWKESSDMMENMYQGAIARLEREYKRIRELQAENKEGKEKLLECTYNYYSLMEELKEYKEAARSEAEEVNRLQDETKKLRSENSGILITSNSGILITSKINERIDYLQAENKKLREALEQIAYHVGKFPIHESYCELSHIAREALKVKE